MSEVTSNEIPSGKPDVEQTVKYWQWILSIPKDKNPLNTGNINNDEFICLPCTGGGEDCSRKLDLSERDAKKDILVPVFASEYCTAEVLNGTDEELLETARRMATPIHMEVSIDENPLVPYYVETEPFEVTVPISHVLDNIYAPPGTYRAISAGFWHRLKPLSTGKHIIRFGGTGTNGFYTKVIYEVNVPRTEKEVFLNVRIL
jgi:hypothetical protein